VVEAKGRAKGRKLGEKFPEGARGGEPFVEQYFGTQRARARRGEGKREREKERVWTMVEKALAYVGGMRLVHPSLFGL
jgi:hypothetical protein